MGREKFEDLKELIKELFFYATGIYLLLIFLMFPLYVEDSYRWIDLCKWKFYLYVTVPYLAVMLLGGINRNLMGRLSGGRVQSCDLIALAYGVCVLITLLSGENRQVIWTGAEGWYMGARAQLLFLATYFAVSRSEISVSLFLACSALGSGVCFLIGILQRLGWDVLHLYEGVDNILLSDYFSTVGNRTWMSGYACVVFPLGVYLFWQAGDRKQKWLWGLYCVVAFAGLAATYSDSAYMGLGVVFLALGIMSAGNSGKWLSLCQLLCIWFGQAVLMCGLRAVRGGRVRDARGLTCYVYEWKWMLAGLAVCALLTLGACLRRVQSSPQKSARTDQHEITGNVSTAGNSGGKRKLAVVTAGGLLLILSFVCNTAGILEKVFPVAIRSRYFRFDDQWGDMRGGTWRMVWRMFKELPLLQKIFGIGADSFAFYCYSRPEYASDLERIWEGAILTNAHNEWLNMFFCQGILGGLAYLGIFVSGAAACLGRTAVCQNRTGERKLTVGAETVAEQMVPEARSVAAGIGLCILAYMAHNFFCYQQICATGPMFVLLGVAGALQRSE